MVTKRYKWAYFDIGLKALFHKKNWHIGVEGAYQKAFNPEMYAYLGSGLDFELGDTSGYYYEIPVKYDINNKYSIEISYKYDYWKISKSNIVNGYYEPNSKTKNKIIKIGMIYKW